ncbi:hypothetical protein BU251_06700 [Candidatus Velamenicoccus archaeovorus]|uniref:Uncharacterized protein n=1 Tax=Velamenicoccus archaeovorus TaxID=1930593 RepID=A0A410P5H2_VELA1|nr:hypothetical protein [Candidatus Velamenicoccus archaeovorus]QAT17426.1 hypothetical protein BU251_06700 [Candidatus Velamenicoccus archaeovorus]
MFQKMSNIRSDFIASHLRAQIRVLGSLLDQVEQDHMISDSWAEDNLKKVEASLRQVRKIWKEN